MQISENIQITDDLVELKDHVELWLENLQKRILEFREKGEEAMAMGARVAEIAAQARLDGADIGALERKGKDWEGARDEHFAIADALGALLPGAEKIGAHVEYLIEKNL
jgi:hypothetical protein